MTPTKTFGYCLALLPLIGTASPLIPLSTDGTSGIYIVTNAAVTYNDNLFYQANKTGDVIYKISPGLELTTGGDGSNAFKLNYHHDLSAYHDHHDLNTQLANVQATYSYDTGAPLTAKIHAGFVQNAQPTFETAAAVTDALVHTNNFKGGANLEHRLTEKTKLSLGTNYTGNRYVSYADRFNNTDTFVVPVNWYYSLTEKLSAGLTYQFTNTSIMPNSGTQSGLADGTQRIHFGGFTSRGQLTEKITIEANAGLAYVDTDYVSAGSATNTTFNFNLTGRYAITEKLSTTVSAGRNFGVSAQGDQTVNTNINIGLSYRITQDWSANAGAGYTVQTFEGLATNGRKDKIITFNAGTNYSINKYTQVGASYTYFHDTVSNAPNFDYNIVTINLGFKY